MIDGGNQAEKSDNRGCGSQSWRIKDDDFPLSEWQVRVHVGRIPAAHRGCH